jgi:hypothetical protein
MRFWLKFVSIASIAGVFAWAASAAPLQVSGGGEDVGYGYGAAKVTICHIPPGNPDNAHTITVGAPAVPAHLAHGDTLGPCPEVVAAAVQNAGTQQKTNHGKGKSKQSETPTATSSTTDQTSAAPAPQQKQKKPKREKPAQSNGVGHAPAPSTDVQSPGNSSGHGNGNAGGNGNGKANGKDK